MPQGVAEGALAAAEAKAVDGHSSFLRNWS
jgi:hypothetical protein